MRFRICIRLKFYLTLFCISAQLKHTLFSKCRVTEVNVDSPCVRNSTEQLNHSELILRIDCHFLFLLFLQGFQKLKEQKKLF